MNAPLRIIVQRARQPAAASSVVTILTVGDGQCRFPLGHPQGAETVLCGRAAEDGPYCPKHRRIAYRRPGESAEARP